jgi:hypothetical protein
MNSRQQVRDVVAPHRHDHHMRMKIHAMTHSYGEKDFHLQEWLNKDVRNRKRKFPACYIYLTISHVKLILATIPWHGDWCLTHRLILAWSCSRTLFEKLIVPQLVKTFMSFYIPRRFITMIKRACDWCLFWAKLMQFTLSHPSSSIYE